MVNETWKQLSHQYMAGGTWLDIVVMQHQIRKYISLWILLSLEIFYSCQILVKQQNNRRYTEKTARILGKVKKTEPRSVTCRIREALQNLHTLIGRCLLSCVHWARIYAAKRRKIKMKLYVVSGSQTHNIVLPSGATNDEPYTISLLRQTFPGSWCSKSHCMLRGSNERT